MKLSPAFSSAARVVIALAAFPAMAHAHPGHDGHDLTWDLGHLAAHPLATFMWIVLFSAGVWSSAKVASFTTQLVQIKSRQPARGRSTEREQAR